MSLTILDLLTTYFINFKIKLFHVFLLICLAEEVDACTHRSWVKLNALLLARIERPLLNERHSSALVIIIIVLCLNGFTVLDPLYGTYTEPLHLSG